MFSIKFFIGVVVALLSGVFNNLGALIQKRAVNDYLKEKILHSHVSMDYPPETPIHKYSAIEIKMTKLITSRTWILGFGIQLILGTAFFVFGQILIGPSLTPALGSIGLIVLFFGSFNIVHEKLTVYEIFGIVIMIGAIFLLAFSDLEINGAEIDLLDRHFLFRAIVFTVVIAAVGLFCKAWSRRRDKLEGTLLATLSGLLIALSNLWIFPVTSIGFDLIANHGNQPTLKHHPTGEAVVLVLVSAVILVYSNVQAVVERQLAFRVGNAATMIPISHVPSHLSAPIIYSFVFLRHAPTNYSLALMWVGIIMLLASSFIFAKREAAIEQQQVAQLTEEENPLVL